MNGSARFTTAARVRLVLSRLLGPWGWALAGLGAVLIAVPGGRYYTADVAATGHLPQAGRRLPPAVRSDAGFLADAAENLPPRAAVWVDRAPPGPPGAGRPRHPRRLAVRWRGPAFPVADRFDKPFLSHRPDDDPVDGPAAAWDSPAWGVRWRRGTTGWEFWGPARQWDVTPKTRFGGIDSPFDRDAGRWETHGMAPLPDTALRSYIGPWAWRERELAVSLWWFAGAPLLVSLVRLWRGVRSGWGDPRPAGRWRRAVGPFATTAALFAAAAAAADSEGPDRTWWALPGAGAGCSVRSDPFSAWHPRFVRVTFDRPADRSPGRSVGSRRWGFQFSRTRGPGVIHDLRDDDPDFAPPGTARTAADLSLWYLFLPAALWGGVGLWRTRGSSGSPAGRMRPA